MRLSKKQSHKEEHVLCGVGFNHCASICPHKDGVLIAWYAGRQEAVRDQEVNVVYWESGEEYRGQFKVGARTGNPVIWAMSKKKACLLYSYFENVDVRPVKRWGYCSNWLTPIEHKPSRNQTWASYVHRQLELEIGYLGRCQPIKVNDRWYLPLYRELDPYGLIMVSKDGWNWEELSRFGVSDHDAATRFGKGILMQPTLWSDGSRMFALCRNVAKTGRAWFGQSFDMGATWSDPAHTSIPNHNNSIVVLHDGTDNPWVIWNQDRMRTALLLGKIDGTDAVPYYRLNKNKASYPNYCVDYDGAIHVVHSDRPHIKHHIFNRAWLDELAKGPPLSVESDFSSRPLSDKTGYTFKEADPPC